MTYFSLDNLSFLMAGLVIVITAIITSFSRRYMDGDRHYKVFFLTLLSLSASVLLLAFANHIALFGGAWVLTGLLLAKLIGHVEGWSHAQNSASLARSHFLFGSFILATGLGILHWQTGAWNIYEITSTLDRVDPIYLWLSGGLIVIAAMVQSALFPFHKWLLSSMTAPTPVSAFMHAGLVNAGGFLIVRFAPLFNALPDLLLIIFVLGALSALLGSYWMMSQTNVKGNLACSTSAQMGFMVLQCGLGFYAAAIAHLIFHGFFKAYHFLSAGSAVETVKAPKDSERLSLHDIPIIILGGIVAAVSFTVLSGKSLVDPNSGALLIAFATFAGMQAAKGFANMHHMHYAVRASLASVVIALAAALYAGLFVVIGGMLSIDTPQALSPVHGVVLGVFTIAWLALFFDAHIRAPKAYMKSLNAAQPPLNTILNNRSSYHAG